MPTSARAINRRTVLTLPLLSATASALPAITGRAAESTLRYVPYSNLIVIDPVWSISIIGLEHAFLTCDQLYGLDESYTPRPQMAAGHELSDDKRRWRITLRDGLVFHDGERFAPPIASPRSRAGPSVIRSANAWPHRSTRCTRSTTRRSKCA